MALFFLGSPLDDIDDSAPVAVEDDDNFGGIFDGLTEEQSSANPEDAFGLDLGAGLDTQEPAEVNEAFAAWEISHKKALAAKAEKIRADKKALEAEAKKELDAFYAKRKATLASSQAENVANEEKAKKAQNESSDNHWKKVSSYCDLKPRTETGKASQQKKNERMRTLLVDLKNEKK